LVPFVTVAALPTDPVVVERSIPCTAFTSVAVEYLAVLINVA